MNDSILSSALEVRRQSGKGLTRQFLEALTLRLGATKLGITEYYFYRVFANQFSTTDRERFAGFRLERFVDDVFNSLHWWATANDKFLFYSMLDSLEIRYPRLFGIYSPTARRLPGTKVLRDVKSVADFVRDSSHYPMFMKPLHGSFGRGACSAARFEPETDTVVLGNGERWPVQEAVKTFVEPSCKGYLFQQLGQPHEELRALCGPTVSSVRVMLLLEETGPKILICTWKIATGANMIDNFFHGQTGNLLAAVDVETGRVTRIVQRAGVNQTEIENHPDTGKRILGVCLPQWQEVRNLALEGSAAFPGLRLQHWDIALAEGGPMALELNVRGGLDLHQVASGVGGVGVDLKAALDKDPRGRKGIGA